MYRKDESKRASIFRYFKQVGERAKDFLYTEVPAPTIAFPLSVNEAARPTDEVAIAEVESTVDTTLK